MAPLASVQNWPPGGATCISCKIGQHLVPLAVVAMKLIVNLATNCQSHTNQFFNIYVHHHISLHVNLHVGHLIGHLVNLHDKHHKLSNITSISIINYQSLSVKSSVGIFTLQGHISQLGSTVSLTDWLTHTITSRASCDAKNEFFAIFPLKSKKITDIERKGPRAKTKTVLKLVSKMQQLGSMQNF